MGGESEHPISKSLSCVAGGDGGDAGGQGMLADRWDAADSGDAGGQGRCW